MKCINGYIISDDIIREMVGLLEKSKMEQIEYGCAVCATLPNRILILRNICSGDNSGVAISGQYDNGHEELVGDYHTHIGKELPSFFDLDFDNIGNYNEMKFIGGVTTSRINCYIVKKIDIAFLDGISKLEQMFYDTILKHRKKSYSKQEQKRIAEEFINVHDASMNKLIDEYIDVIEII